MTTWPYPARPGVPLNPENSGPHWLRNNGRISVSNWLSHKGSWIDAPFSFGCSAKPPEVARWNDYVAPCLTPDEASALQARGVKWAGIVGSLLAERNQLIGALQLAVERSGDMEHPPAWVEGACGILNRGFLKIDCAALAEALAVKHSLTPERSGNAG